MDKIKQLIARVSGLWSQWTLVKKIILIGVVVAVIGAFSAVVSANAKPSMVALYSTPITDPLELSGIQVALDEANISTTVMNENMLYVEDDVTARRARAILIREDKTPGDASAFAILDQDRFTLTQWDRDQNLRRAITKNLEQHIESLEDIDNAHVTLVIPDDEYFTDLQKPTTVSVSVTPSPDSDIDNNRKKVKGIQRMIELAVQVDPEHITIINTANSLVLNDFENLEAFDRIALGNKEMKQKLLFESQYKTQILKALQKVFTADRVAIMNLDITLDTKEKIVEKEEHPMIEVTPDNPTTPYSEREVTPSITISHNTKNEEFEGTGFNPEGPPGQEGQTPPAYKDLEGMVGRYSNQSETINNVVNTIKTKEVSSPWSIEKVSTAIVIDGVWKKVYNDDGTVKMEKGSIVREYIPVTPEEIKKAKASIEGAISFDNKRGDLVSVETIAFDRTSEFEEEDEKERRAQQRNRIILFSLLGLVIVVAAFIIFRIVSKELEKRRRQREEELARQHQAMREAALRSAEEDGIEVEMSVEDRARLEMQENAINMAREHPEDVAQLIRTWLSEE